LIKILKNHGFTVKDLGNDNYIADYKHTISIVFSIKGDTLTGASFWNQMVEGAVLRRFGDLKYKTDIGLFAIRLFTSRAVAIHSDICKNQLPCILYNLKEVARSKLTKTGEYRFANSRLYNRNSNIGELVVWTRQYNQVSDTMDIRYCYNGWCIHNFGKGYHMIDPNSEYHGIKESLEKALSYIDKEE
jgi:hypothetical protein